jgi:hypothetical protein
MQILGTKTTSILPKDNMADNIKLVKLLQLVRELLFGHSPDLGYLWALKTD